MGVKDLSILSFLKLNVSDHIAFWVTHDPEMIEQPLRFQWGQSDLARPYWKPFLSVQGATSSHIPNERSELFWKTS